VIRRFLAVKPLFSLLYFLFAFFTGILRGEDPDAFFILPRLLPQVFFSFLSSAPSF